jgi:hypothetical protein
VKPWRAIEAWWRAAHRPLAAPAEAGGDTLHGLWADYTQVFVRDPYTGALRLAAKRIGGGS